MSEPRQLTRRRFLQAIAASGSALAIPSWLADAAGGATPLGPGEGTLVVLLLDGGNDGLNTVAPVGDGTYQDKRRGLALSPSAALPLASGFGLHPSLARLHDRYRDGKVAFLRGIGDVEPDLSHFNATARVMGGDGSDGAHGGWLGRYLDRLPGTDPLDAVSLSSSTPLAVTGERRRATALPVQNPSPLSTTANDEMVRSGTKALLAMCAPSTELGWWGDCIASTTRDAVELSARLAPMYQPRLGDGLPARLELVARLINANAGIRVLHVRQGGYDHHADEASQHAALLDDLDEAIEHFYATLDGACAGRVTMLVMSEFGRRIQSNASGGTDHGSANTWMLLGDRVHGGLHGTPPSLTRTDRAGNLVPTVDYRALYATILESWFGADAGDILGGHYGNLGLLDRPA